MAKKNNKLPNFEKMAKDFIKEVSPHIAEKAKGFFKGSFIKEGFTDYAFIAWPKRKDTLPHKVLTKSQALRDSIVIKEASRKRVVIEAGQGIPYASIHNTGGTISVPVTEKSRRFFWYMYMQTKEERWKWMALTKKDRLSVRMPQRKFIGKSQMLNKQIQQFMVEQMKKAELKLKKELK